MHKFIKSLAVFMALSMALLAQSQIATVTSDSSFQLRGAGVTPGQGVPSWPALAGDTLQAGQTPVTLTFADGSTLMLSPGSSATVNMAGSTPIFELLSGSADYMLKTLTSAQLQEKKKVVVPTALIGELFIGDHKKVAAGAVAGTGAGAAAGTAGHVALLVIGASAAATGLAVGVAQSISTSPSK